MIGSKVDLRSSVGNANMTGGENDIDDVVRSLRFVQTYFAQDDFGSEILGCSTKGPGPALNALCETKIRDL